MSETDLLNKFKRPGNDSVALTTELKVFQCVKVPTICDESFRCRFGLITTELYISFNNYLYPANDVVLFQMEQ